MTINPDDTTGINPVPPAQSPLIVDTFNQAHRGQILAVADRVNKPIRCHMRNRSDGYVPPCVPTRAYKAPAGPGWVHEIKHDGYRLQGPGAGG